MIGWIYTALLLTVVLFIVTRGGIEERVAIATLLLGSFGTFAIYSSFGRDFTALQMPLLVNDGAVLAVLLVIAYRSKRFWPLPVAACQLAAWLSLLTPSFGENIVSYGLGVAQGIWAYPQLVLLVLAVIRTRKPLPDTTPSAD